jgi:hypothetical protein
MRSFAIALGLAAALAATACRQEGPAERAGRALDEAAEDIRDSGEDALDDLRRGLDDAAESVEEAIEDARKKARE